MNDDLKEIKERIYNEDLIEDVLNALECKHVKLVGDRYEAQLPDKFNSDNRRSVQVKCTSSLSSSVRSRDISGDIMMLIGYILYDTKNFEELLGHLYQVKVWICNIFDWNEFLSRKKKVAKKDYLYFLRDFQKKRKSRIRLEDQLDKENEVLVKNVMEQYLAIAHIRFKNDGICRRTQIFFGVRYDLLSDRIVFPIHNKDGEIVSVKGRYVGNEDDTDRSNYKYLYLYNFDKSIELYNYHRSIKHIQDQKEVIVFESEKSCMIAWELGIKNTVAIGGSSISPVQLSLLKRIGVNIVFALDNDIEESYIERQSLQLKSRVCYYIKDVDGLLDEKSSPIDKGKLIWEKLYSQKVKLK